MNKISNLFKRFFEKGDNEMIIAHLPKEENETFMLKVDNIDVGVLHCEEGIWEFKYAEEFKKHNGQYNLITGFSNINKTYKSDALWPFFKTRIPGLKQPAVKEILKKENISEENEAALLRRFGKKTISNPYELDLA